MTRFVEEMMRDTVVVLGAGTSAPYKFPLGSELRDAILGDWNRPLSGPAIAAASRCENVFYAQTKALEPLLRDHPLWASFQRQLRRQEYSSVDRFLEQPQNRVFEQIGLVSTALVIGCCQYQMLDALQLPSREGRMHVFRSLFDLLTSVKGCGRRLRIITFNYDTALETYVSQVVAARSGESDDRARHLVREWMEVEHVYGSIGIWSDELADEFVQLPRKWAEVAARQLRVVPTARDDDAVFERCRDWISGAEVLAFYGFGYDTTNLARLGLRSPNDYSGKDILGSSTSGTLPDYVPGKVHGIGATFFESLSRMMGF